MKAFVQRGLSVACCSFTLALPVAAAPSVEACLTASDASLAELESRDVEKERSALQICADPSCPQAIRDECKSRLASLKTRPQTDATGPAGAHAGTQPTTQPGAPAEEVASPKVTVAGPDRSETTSPWPGGFSTRESVALASGVVGAVGLSVAAAYTLSALAKRDRAREHCPGAVCSDELGRNRWDAAADAGNSATLWGVIGAVGVASGAVLWFLVPGDQPSSTAATRFGIRADGMVFWEGTL